DLVLRLEHLAQRERRRLEDLFIEAAVVLDRRRLIHGLDHRERQLRGAGDHQDGTRVALSPVDRHLWLLVAIYCSGDREVGSRRGWPETGAIWLRTPEPGAVRSFDPGLRFSSPRLICRLPRAGSAFRFSGCAPRLRRCLQRAAGTLAALT